MFEQRLSIPYETIANFCQRHHIRKLSLFGSVLRDDFRPDSDVDVLVEFEPDAKVRLLDMGAPSRVTYRKNAVKPRPSGLGI